MSEFTVNATVWIPTELQVRVKWDGKYVAHLAREPLRRTTEVVRIARRRPQHHPQIPGLPTTTPSPGSGVNHDVEFEHGPTGLEHGAGLGVEVSLPTSAKLILELYNEAGQLVLAYKIFRCWVSDTSLFLNSMQQQRDRHPAHQARNEGWSATPTWSNRRSPLSPFRPARTIQPRAQRSVQRRRSGMPLPGQ